MAIYLPTNAHMRATTIAVPAVSQITQWQALSGRDKCRGACAAVAAGKCVQSQTKMQIISAIKHFMAAL